MTASGAMPDLWEGVLSPKTISPVAVLRTQAGNFNKTAEGLLRAEVTTSPDSPANPDTKRHHFLITAPGANGYQRQVLTLEHKTNELYPATVYSGFLNPIFYGAEPSEQCNDQPHLLKTLEKIFKSARLVAELHSLFAQINEATPDD